MKMVEVHHVSRSEAHERAIALIQKLRPLGCFADEDGIWGELDFLMICLKPTVLATKAVPIGEGELPPLDEEYEREAAALKGLMPHGPLLLKLRAESRERQLLQSQQQLLATTKNRDQWERNSAAENKRAGDALVELARLRSQERPEDAWSRALAVCYEQTGERMWEPYTPPK